MYGVFEKLLASIDQAMGAHTAFEDIGKKLQFISSTITSFSTGVVSFPDCKAESFQQDHVDNADVWCENVGRAAAGINIRDGLNEIYQKFCESKSCQRTVESETGLSLEEVFSRWADAVQQLQVAIFCVWYHRYTAFVGPLISSILFFVVVFVFKQCT